MKNRKKLTGMLLAAPVLLGTFVFFLLPFAICVKYSFTFGVGGAYFVGLDNYKEVFSSYAFQLAAVNTLRFLVVGVTLNLVLSFFYCAADEERIGGKSLFPLHPFVASGASHSQCCYGYSGVFFRNRDYQSLAAIHRSADCAMVGRTKCFLCIIGLIYMEKLWI